MIKLASTCCGDIVRRLFRLVGRRALQRFENRTRNAIALNTATLQRILRHQQRCDFGYRHSFSAILKEPDLLRAYRAAVPLSNYADYESDIERIAAGELSILTADRVHILAQSAGTTAAPKRIPRTRRAQRQHMVLVVLADQAVVDAAARPATSAGRGINLMSLAVPPTEANKPVPLMAGPNAGVARLRHWVPFLFCAPVAVHRIEHQPTALYLHALFALADRDAQFIETPFAPKIVGWFSLMDRYRQRLIDDLRAGTLSEHLRLTGSERAAVQRHWRARPRRATEVEQAFAAGLAGLLPRLWPQLRYIRTVTSGTFALSLPRLRWLAGPEVLIHSTCHSSSEGVIGLNLSAAGNDYVLAVGSAYFEFIPLAEISVPNPTTVELADLELDQDYEIVMTNWAGFYRYRLGDIVRIVGRHGQAPLLRYLYRRGTILNLVGEKTTEAHTAEAVTQLVARWLGDAALIRDYAVHGAFEEGVAGYTVYLELDEAPSPPADMAPAALLDATFRTANPYYWQNGREPERMRPPVLKLLHAGSFAALGEWQRQRAAGLSPDQVKIPRALHHPEQLALLERGVIACYGTACYGTAKDPATPVAAAAPPRALTEP